jgi:hypothetical protein
MRKMLTCCRWIMLDQAAFTGGETVKVSVLICSLDFQWPLDSYLKSKPIVQWLSLH